MRMFSVFTFLSLVEMSYQQYLFHHDSPFVPGNGFSFSLSYELGLFIFFFPKHFPSATLIAIFLSMNLLSLSKC